MEARQSVIASSDLNRWGFRLQEKNEFGDFREIKVKRLGHEDELRVLEMIGLKVQWVDGDVIIACYEPETMLVSVMNKDVLSKEDVEFVIAKGVEENGAIKVSDLPVKMRPTMSFFHDVS